MKHKISDIGREMLKFQEKLAKEHNYMPVEPNLFEGDVRQRYLEALPSWCSISGSKLPLQTLDETPLCSGYCRIVVGDYGAFVEVAPEQMRTENLRCKPGQEYRMSDDAFKNHVKYFWFTATDDSDIKVYFQQKPVKYADYVPGMYYFSPYEVMPCPSGAGNSDLSHIMLLEIEENLGALGLVQDKVVLYNANRISEEKALCVTESGEFNENVLCIPKKQWEALFCNKEV